MITKLIGIKEFRQNISDFTQKAQKGNGRYIIMNRNKPLFELKPFKDDQDLENIFADIIVAKEDIKKGRVYSQDDILAEFA